MFYVSLVLLITSLILYVYWRLKKTYSYFQRHGVPHIEPDNWIFGNMTDIFLQRKSFIVGFEEFYWKLEPHTFGGLYHMQKPMLIIRDPELLRNVMVKDFEYFQDRTNPQPNEVDLFSHNLFNLKGEMWKNLRIKLTSTFTSGKMKMMFPLVNECGRNLYNILTTSADKEALEIKSLAARFTTDVIGSCAFGIETGCLANPNSEFSLMAKRIFKFRYKSLIPVIWKTMPVKLIKLFKLTFLEEEVQNFFLGITRETVQYREKHNISRNDFLDLLIALKNNTTISKYQDIDEKEDLEKFMAQIGDKLVKSNVEMTPELMAAQCVLFFLAGYETSSTTIAFMLLELSKNHHIQNKVRDEINELLEKYDGQITYDLLKNMPYTDMVMAETLRKYPPTGALMRECTKNYKIANTELTLPVGTPIIISLMGLHNDAKYYEKPDAFYPEHFTEEAKSNRPHFTYMPFGDGPRVCIAERFAKMQIKVGLIHMLKDFSYSISPKMKLPIEFDVEFALSVKGGIWLQCKRI